MARCLAAIDSAVAAGAADPRLGAFARLREAARGTVFLFVFFLVLDRAFFTFGILAFLPFALARTFCTGFSLNEKVNWPADRPLAATIAEAPDILCAPLGRADYGNLYRTIAAYVPPGPPDDKLS
jgi:hypothetical protein